VRKFHWADFLMSASAYVDQAVWWSKELTRFRSRGPGDTDNAMRAIERDYGLDYWLLWRLRYRRRQIKDIGVSIYARLELRTALRWSANTTSSARQSTAHENSSEMLIPWWWQLRLWWTRIAERLRRMRRKRRENRAMRRVFRGGLN
jgi:hypothetical protein